tara:strand:+ start:4770 stop:5519 length:750 start_codon:yes stop_codon:yes gene_type:complete
MISKSTLQSFISKYNLGGLYQKAKWRVKDNTLTVYINDSGLNSKVHLNDFQLEDGHICMVDTNKLKKLIAITNGELILTLEKHTNTAQDTVIYTKLLIADENFDLSFSLSDKTMFGKESWIEHPEEGYDLEMTLSNIDIDNLLKAKNALGDVNEMMISSQKDLDGNDVCEFKFGDNNSFSNKIVFNAPATTNNIVDSVIYNSDMFKRILDANKDMESCTMKISNVGWSYFVFMNDGLTSEYFIRQDEPT